MVQSVPLQIGNPIRLPGHADTLCTVWHIMLYYLRVLRAASIYISNPSRKLNVLGE